ICGVLCRRMLAERARVAFKPCEFSAFDGAATKARGVKVGCEREDVVEFGGDAIRARLKASLIGRLLETIPRADVLTDVATVEPAVEIGGDLCGHFFGAQFDGRVRDATVRVQDVRLGDRLCRAGVNAERT